jgi:hypothetical protein
MKEKSKQSSAKLCAIVIMSCFIIKDLYKSDENPNS